MARDLGTGTEDRRSNPDMGGTECDRGFKIMAHAHTQALKPVARGDLGEEGEVQGRLLVDSRNAHQPFGIEAALVSQGSDKGIGINGGDPRFLRLLSGIDLNEKALGARGKLGLLIENCAQPVGNPLRTP